MIAAVTKELTFDCAHMLSGHYGRCANLHGHTYKMQVTIQAPMQERPGASDDRMVMDFAKLKKLLEQIVMERFDHAVIFSCAPLRNKAEESLFQWAKENDMRYFVMDSRTTSEHMAEYFRRKIIEELDQHYFTHQDVHVRLWETPTSFAEV